MPRFAYKAKEGPDKIVNGVIEAQSLDSAISKIIQQGFAPIDVTQAAQGMADVSEKRTAVPLRFSSKIRSADLSVFTRQMSDLIDASVPMLRALQVTVRQTENPKLKEIINNMMVMVRDGDSFSQALARQDGIFTPLYVHMVRSGEISGKLNIVLNRLADYLEKEVDTRNKVRMSLAYPALILGVGVLMIFVLLTFIIPRLSIMFEDMDQTLPLVTVIVMGLSSVFARFWWVMLAVAGLGYTYFKRWIDTAKGRRWLDTLKLKTPVLGHFLRVVEVGRFARTLGTMVESGVSITPALQSVGDTVSNVLLREEIQRVSQEVTNGASLQESLHRTTFFPEMAVNMISIGEETGHLERGLYKIADTYERESDQAVRTMINLLGPLVLIGVFIIVGFFIIAMLLPILQMNMLIQ